MRIAILLTSFNRKEYTLNILSQIEEQKNHSIGYEVFLTDDKSSDGTYEEVEKRFPKTNLLKGNGSLYWAGGMRSSWREALKGNFDGYLLLNDDTYIFPSLLKNIENGISYMNEMNSNGILIGSTKDRHSNELTYGGNIYISKLKATYKRIEPNDSYQLCEVGNANIMYVDSSVVRNIGILDSKFIHGVADFDYSYKAFKKGFAVYVLPEFQGYCSAHKITKREKFFQLKKIRDRYEFLKSPVGFAFWDNFHFQLSHFPLRLPLTIFFALVKLFIPSLYLRIENLIR